VRSFFSPPPNLEVVSSIRIPRERRAMVTDTPHINGNLLKADIDMKNI
jgi:hypothetical protein